MRKVLLATVATMACAVIPASAPAHEHGRDHFRSHERDMGLRSDTPGVAGRITSHSNDNLTITTNDGSVLSGKVTDDTAVFCIRHSTSSSSSTGDDDQGDGDQSSAHDSRFHRFHSGFRDARWAGDSGLEIARCSPIDDLKPGRRIAGALLKVTPSGNVWKFVLVWD